MKITVLLKFKFKNDVLIEYLPKFFMCNFNFNIISFKSNSKIF